MKAIYNSSILWIRCRPLSKFLLLAIISLTIGCRSGNQPASFVHEIQEGPTPWSGEPLPHNAQQFTFAIISDLYGGERAGIFDVAVQQLRLLQPQFIMSVGDLIDGGTEDRTQLNTEWNRFDQRAADTPAPIFHVGGNHDLTNVVMREVWKERYGRRYYHFVYNDVLFLVLDSEDYTDERMQQIYHARAEYIEVVDGPNPAEAVNMLYFKMPERGTGEISDDQSTYFEEVLKKYPEVRWTLLFMHKPVWLRKNPGGLERIEAALSDRSYTVFNGHRHTYSYTERNERDYIMLGTTGGAQNNRSETAFDHLTLVTMTDNGPSIANLRLDGILDKNARIPAGGDTLCFQASACAIHGDILTK